MRTDRQTHAHTHTHFMVVCYVVGVATTKGDDDLLDDWLNDLNSITSSNSQQVCIRLCACVHVCDQVFVQSCVDCSVKI